MTARVLVIDDILPNVKLLEARLSSEYFDVITATSGPEGLEKAETQSPDVILLDVMMPGMDGFEVCQRLKSNPATANIPVVMVTALTDATDRVRGLEVGADDFLTKPVNDIALMARVRSLVRLKMMVDEWKAREKTSSQFGFNKGEKSAIIEELYDKAQVLIVEDKDFESEKFVETLKRDDDVIIAVRTGEQGLQQAMQNNFDVIILSINLAGEDGLRLCQHFRSNEHTRAVPILVVCEETDTKRIAMALEIGAHDYIMRPIDRNELLARVHTQIRRKRFQDRLRANYEKSLALALTDTLTGLYNRRYMTAHLESLLKKNAETRKTLAIMMLDIDKFKSVNDTYGHAAGDEVLKVFAERVSNALRPFDLVVRLGGEEFVVVLPDVNTTIAKQVAERIRRKVASAPFPISVAPNEIPVTVSIGMALIPDGNATMDEALHRADAEVYKAKENGRNRVYLEGEGMVSQDLPPPPDDNTAKTIAGAI